MNLLQGRVYIVAVIVFLLGRKRCGITSIKYMVSMRTCGKSTNQITPRTLNEGRYMNLGILLSLALMHFNVYPCCWIRIKKNRVQPAHSRSFTKATQEEIARIKKLGSANGSDNSKKIEKQLARYKALKVNV
jgi:hypothetical protein